MCVGVCVCACVCLRLCAGVDLEVPRSHVITYSRFANNLAKEPFDCYACCSETQKYSLLFTKKIPYVKIIF